MTDESKKTSKPDTTEQADSAQPAKKTDAAPPAGPAASPTAGSSGREPPGSKPSAPPGERPKDTAPKGEGGPKGGGDKIEFGRTAEPGKPGASGRAAETAKPSEAGKPAEPARAAEVKPAETAKPSAGPGSVPPAAGTGAGSTGSRQPPPKPSEKKSGCLSSALVVLLVIAGIAAAGYFTQDQWSPAVGTYVDALPSPGRDARIAELEARLETVEAFEAKIADIETAVAGLQSQVGDELAELANTQNRLAEAGAALNSKQSAKAAELRDAVDALRGRTAALEQGMGPGGAGESGDGISRSDGPAATQAVAAMVRLVESQADRLKALEDRIATFDDARIDVSGLGALESRIAVLESAVKAGRDVATMSTKTAVSITRLIRALDGSAPFEQELDAAILAAGADSPLAEAVSPIEPYASSGIPTFVQLQRQFGTVVDAVVQARYKSAADGTLARALNRLSELFTVRRTGESAEGTDAQLADAEAGLRNGDLASAVVAVESIDETLPDPVTTWLADAKARLEADRAVDWLQTFAAVALSADEDKG